MCKGVKSNLNLDRLSELFNEVIDTNVRKTLVDIMFKKYLKYKNKYLKLKYTESFRSYY